MPLTGSVLADYEKVWNENKGDSSDKLLPLKLLTGSVFGRL
jgi:hypothetical protein